MIYGPVLTIAIYLIRYVLTWILGPNDITRRETNLLAFMIPKGLAAAVLVQILINSVDSPSQEMKNIQSIIYSVIFFSIVLSTILIYFEENKKKEVSKE